MAVKAKKTRAPAAKRKTKSVKPPKKPVRRKKAARKPETTLEKIENAMMAGVAEFELALDMGLLGAAGPAPKKKRKKTRR